MNYFADKVCGKVYKREDKVLGKFSGKILRGSFGIIAKEWTQDHEKLVRNSGFSNSDDTIDGGGNRNYWRFRQFTKQNNILMRRALKLMLN